MGTHYARAETDRDEERKRDPVKFKLHYARSLATRKGLPKCHVMEQVDILNGKKSLLHFLIYKEIKRILSN